MARRGPTPRSRGSAATSPTRGASRDDVQRRLPGPRGRRPRRLPRLVPRLRRGRGRDVAGAPPRGRGGSTRTALTARPSNGAVPRRLRRQRRRLPARRAGRRRGRAPDAHGAGRRRRSPRSRSRRPRRTAARATSSRAPATSRTRSPSTSSASTPTACPAFADRGRGRVLRGPVHDRRVVVGARRLPRALRRRVRPRRRAVGRLALRRRGARAAHDRAGRPDPRAGRVPGRRRRWSPASWAGRATGSPSSSRSTTTASSGARTRSASSRRTRGRSPPTTARSWS